MLPVSLMVAGAAIALWAGYHDRRSASVLTVGVMLFALGFAILALGLGLWLGSRNRPRPRSG
jgi:hypothetical protein